MSNGARISVTLSDDLLDQLRLQSQQLHVPLKWLVAGLVLDTSESAAAPTYTDDYRVRFLQRAAEPAI
jgi:hypothetical protein